MAIAELEPNETNNPKKMVGLEGYGLSKSFKYYQKKTPRCFSALASVRGRFEFLLESSSNSTPGDTAATHRRLYEEFLADIEE